MMGWIAGAAALAAIVVAGVNLDFIRKTDTFVDTFQQNLAATIHSMQTASSSLAISSVAFQHEGSIAAQYTCDANTTPTNPPLRISGIPSTAKSLALIVDDPDVPKALRPDGVFDHWILFNIPLPPSGADLIIDAGASVGTPGENGAGVASYAPPCPPKQYEPSEHRYFFKLYALDTMLELPAGATKQQVEAGMVGHILGKVSLVGKYKRL